MSEEKIVEQGRNSPAYISLVAALREVFNPAALEAIRIQLREHRNSRSSLVDLVRAVDDAADVTFDPGKGAHAAVRAWFTRPNPRPSLVGDLVGPNAQGIPDDVLEVVDCDDDGWRRAVGDERYIREGEGEFGRVDQCDWVTINGRGRCSTEWLLEYCRPLRVTRVAERPA